MINKLHHFFLLTSNPWAVYISSVSFNSFFSIMIFFKFQEPISLILNSLLLSLASFYWWISYSKEFSLEGMQSYSLDKSLKFSMALFISSEIFFFFSFFWSYFHYFLSPCMETGLLWPFSLIEMFDFSSVPLVNTCILLSSGVTLTASHHMLDMSFYKLSQFLLSCTIFLGIMFSALQVMEYQSSFFSISDGTFGTSFFVLTGFHGLHVLIGSLYLMSSCFRMSALSSATNDHASFEMSSWYWHFVDVVWLFLFFFVYYLNY